MYTFSSFMFIVNTKKVLDPAVDGIGLPCEREPGNPHNTFAVAIHKHSMWLLMMYWSAHTVSNATVYYLIWSLWQVVKWTTSLLLVFLNSLYSLSMGLCQRKN